MTQKLLDEESKKVKEIVEKHLNLSLIDIKRVSGGLVHYVYKADSKDKTLFVKIRKNHFSVLKNIQTTPEWIAYEKKALDMISRLEPEIFPKVIKYIEEENMLILSDIMPHRRTLELELNESKLTTETAYQLGKTLAEIHKKLSKIKNAIREDGDITYYNQLHFYRFSYHKHPVLDALVKELELLPRQITIGDLSPKNIGVSPEGKITICDLENAHYGNKISDIGFLASSIILHTINDPELAYHLLSAFLGGYSSVRRFKKYNSTIKKIILGVALYRLDNPVIPYEVAISVDEKKAQIETIKQALYKRRLTWEQLTNAITNR